MATQLDGPRNIVGEFIPFNLKETAFVVNLWILLSDLMTALKDGHISQHEFTKLLEGLYALLDNRIRSKAKS